jgi:hypothetical protein
MRIFSTSAFLICVSLFTGSGSCVGLFAVDAPQSEWVHLGAAGRLVYKTTAAGDRILDFSHAGYRGGGVALPDVPVKETVRPSGGADDTAAIQAAVDRVSALPLQDGFRGAVLLAPGTFTCSKSIMLTASGVVLRGSGSGAGGTTIQMTGPKHSAFLIGERYRRGAVQPVEDEVAGSPGHPSAPQAGDNLKKGTTTPAEKTVETTFADAYVPAGATTFTVTDAKGFAVGDMVLIRRPTSAAWTEHMRMHDLKRDGRPQTWLGNGRGSVMERTITALSGNRVTVDVPLAESFDAKLLQPVLPTISKEQRSRISQVGIEHLHVQCPPLEIAYGQAPYSGVRVDGDDCWLRDIYFEETMNTTTFSGKRITAQGVVITHTFPNLGASKPADFSIEGSQIFIDRCASTGGNTYSVWTSSLSPGPNVVLNSVFRGHGSRIQPHHRWSTAVLVDNCAVPDGGIDFPNRGVAGSGHGWTTGWSVAWNCVADFYVIQNPPSIANWAIGNIGRRLQTPRYFDNAPLVPEGIFDSHGKPVAPQSLYLAQLQERLGSAALKAIGYADNAESEFAGRSTPRLPPQAREDDPVLGADLALHRPVGATAMRTSERWREFSGERALDANPVTYWATDDMMKKPAILEIDMEGPVEINALVIEEMTGKTGQVRQYKVEAQVDSDWLLLSEGTTIGARKVDRFPNVSVWKVRLTVLKAEPGVAIRKLGLYSEKR